MPAPTVARRATRVVLSLAAAIAAAVPAGNLAALPAHAASFDIAAAESQMVGLINADRAASSMPPLAVNPTLMSIARDGDARVCGQTVHGRSQDMVDRSYFSHVLPPCGAYVWPTLAAAGVSMNGAGENIGWNNYSPLESVELMNTGFMSSPGHRDNILGDYNQVGVGIVAAPGTWTGGGQPIAGAIIYTEIFINGPLPPAAQGAGWTPLMGGSPLVVCTPLLARFCSLPVLRRAGGSAIHRTFRTAPRSHRLTLGRWR